MYEIYSKRVAEILIRKGFNLVKARPERHSQRVVFVFEDTKEFREVLTNITNQNY